MNAHQYILRWHLLSWVLAAAACNSTPEPYRRLDTRVFCISLFVGEVTLEEAIGSLDRDGNQILDDLDARPGESMAIVEIHGRHRESAGPEPRRGVAMYSSWTGLARRTDEGVAIEMTLACSPTAVLEVEFVSASSEEATQFSSFTFDPVDSEALATADGTSFEGRASLAVEEGRARGWLEGVVSAPLVSDDAFDDGGVLTGQSVRLHRVAFHGLEIAP